MRPRQRARGVPFPACVLALVWLASGLGDALGDVPPASITAAQHLLVLDVVLRTAELDAAALEELAAGPNHDPSLAALFAGELERELGLADVHAHRLVSLTASGYRQAVDELHGAIADLDEATLALVGARAAIAHNDMGALAERSASVLRWTTKGVARLPLLTADFGAPATTQSPSSSLPCSCP